MKIAIGSDHAGFELKSFVKDYLLNQGHEVLDVGTNDENSCHYPKFAYEACLEVAHGNYDKGIVVCGTGVGVSIVANKVKGIRCALCSECFSAKMTRQHNNSNVLALGQNVIGKALALEIVDVFLNTEFLGERHQTRVDMITEIENK